MKHRQSHQLNVRHVPWNKSPSKGNSETSMASGETKCRKDYMRLGFGVFEDATFNADLTSLGVENSLFRPETIKIDGRLSH